MKSPRYKYKNILCSGRKYDKIYLLDNSYTDYILLIEYILNIYSDAMDVVVEKDKGPNELDGEKDSDRE